MAALRIIPHAIIGLALAVVIFSLNLLFLAKPLYTLYADLFQSGQMYQGETHALMYNRFLFVVVAPCSLLLGGALAWLLVSLRRPAIIFAVLIIVAVLLVAAFLHMKPVRATPAPLRDHPNAQRGGGIDGGPLFGITEVIADVNAKPSASNFPLIASIGEDFGRSTSLAMFKKIYHNLGGWASSNYPANFADEDFAHTAAHEVGHLILNEYGDGGLIPEYSWSHKSTSTILTQAPLDNHPVPTGGEIDLMHYHSQGPHNYQDYWQRSIASENDVKSLLWLSRVKFDD